MFPLKATVFVLCCVFSSTTQISLDDFEIEDPRNFGDGEEDELPENSILSTIKTFALHPHINLKALDIIQYNGFEGEEHRVRTEDHYELVMHRIPAVKKDSDQPDKPPVFLMHGILSSSVDWMIAGPEKSLAFILANEGYDVWMGNARGTTYSRKHFVHRTGFSRYWNFSWHEIGQYDLPAMIDYILIKTGQKKLYYVGHSQGTTVFYVMASVRPEYNDKIEAMVSLAPISHSGNMYSPVLRFLTNFLTNAEYLFKILGFNEIQPTPRLLQKLTAWACHEKSRMQRVCLNYLFMITGYNSHQMNTTLLPAIMHHVPAGASVKQFVHYAQIIQAKKFQQFDYQSFRNKRIYGSDKPPEYNLSRITAPVALYYSQNDWLCHPQDVSQLQGELPNCLGKFLVPHKSFNHLDYLYGVDAHQLIYRHILELF